MKPAYVLFWLPGILIGIANGVLRELVFRQFLEELPAHQLSAVSFIMIFGVYAGWALRWLRPASTREAIAVGLTWLALTVGFEFLFGHYVMGHPWGRLIHDYNIAEGRLWVVVLAWIAAAPAVMLRLTGKN